MKDYIKYHIDEPYEDQAHSQVNDDTLTRDRQDPIVRYQVDDLAQYADEGRDKLRYAPASRMYTLNRRFPNESSHCWPFRGQGTQGIEASQYLQEEKSNEMPLVRATENGTVQTESVIVI